MLTLQEFPIFAIFVQENRSAKLRDRVSLYGQNEILSNFFLYSLSSLLYIFFLINLPMQFSRMDVCKICKTLNTFIQAIVHAIFCEMKFEAKMSLGGKPMQVVQFRSWFASAPLARQLVKSY